jgi:Arm DNA-binding domain
LAKMLTIAAIKALKPGTSRREIPDGAVSGLFFILQPSGAASWALRYRVGGKNRKWTIGPYPASDLPAARDHARKAIGEIVQGRDPAAEKRSAKAAASPEQHDLIERVGEQFILRHIRATMRPSWAHEAERMVRKEIMAPWKGRRLSEIQKPDVHNLIDAIDDRPARVVADKVFKTLRRMCGWAADRGLISRSPVEGIKRVSR